MADARNFFKCNFSFDINDEQYYQLPPLVECNFQGQQAKQNFENFETIRQPLQGVARELIEKTKDLRFGWKLKSDEIFSFKLPPSYFTKKINISRDNSENKMKKVENKYDFLPYVEFSNEQVDQIRSEGIFDVQSTSNHNLKYRWKLSRWLIKGTTNIKNTFYKDASSAYDKLEGLGKLLYDEKNFESLWNFSLIHGLYLIIVKFLQIPSIFIGYREKINIVGNQEILNKIEEKRQLHIQKQFNLNFSIYTYFFDQLAKKMNEAKFQQMLSVLKELEKLNSIIADFLSCQYLTSRGELGKNHNEVDKFRCIKNLNIQYDQTKDLQQQIQEQLNYHQQMGINQQDFPADVTKHLGDIVECFCLKNYYKELLKEEINQFKVKLNEKYERDYNFLKKIEHHKVNFINSRTQSHKRQLKKNYQEKLIKELKDKNIKEHLIYEEYSKNKQNYNKQQSKIKKSLQQQNSHPIIRLRFTRYLLPNYEIVEANGEYEMIQIKQYQVTSSYWCWRIEVFCVLYFCCVCNSFNCFYQFGIVSELGLKALISIPPFYNKYSINKQTGEVSKSNRIDTVYSNLQEVYKGMKESREEFEASDDTGIFGKGCVRICNLIEVYIFRFLFVGVFCVLILQPFFILINFTFHLFICTTSIFWVAIFLLLRQMFCIFIYDVDTANREYFNDLDYINPVLPIFVAFGEIFLGMIEVFSTLFFLLFLPILAIIEFTYGIIKYIIRSLYDCFMMGFIHCCGRVPYRSGCLAWRIGGDNITTHIVINYHKLSQEETFCLVAREMEQATIDEYEERFIEKINQPTIMANSYLQPFFSFFNSNYIYSEPQSQYLVQDLKKNIQKRKGLFPIIDEETKKNIRYSEPELIVLKEIIKNFLIKEFQEKNMHPYIWKRFDCSIGDYSKVVDILLNKIFGPSILIPVNSNEQDVQIKLKPENNLQKQIQKAMKGDVNINVPEEYELVKKSPQQHYALQIQVFKKYIPWSQILEYIWKAQSLNQQWSCLNDKTKLFLVNYQLMKK